MTIMINIKKIRKREFIRFNKKVNRIININKNNSKYSETEKIALIKSNLDAFYSSKDIDKVKDCTLIKRKTRLIFLIVFYIECLNPYLQELLHLYLLLFVI